MSNSPSDKRNAGSTPASAMDKLRKKVESSKAHSPQSGSVWKGPEEDGITFSLLSRFLVCRERFRLLVVEGLQPVDSFNHRLQYGQMWHICEEAFAESAHRDQWLELSEHRLLNYAQYLARLYPSQQEQVDHWYNVCRVQFPIYVRYWSKHPDVVARTPILQETAFSIPYSLPSGRIVRLRGKWDSVDLIGSGMGSGIYGQENKTKGDIKEQQLKRQLSFDLQTMLYLTALTQDTGIPELEEVKMKVGVGKTPHERSLSSVKGVRYNVVRRPLSGGKHSIIQHKPSKNKRGETKAEYYKRLGGLIANDASYFFMRWKVEITPQDIQKFRTQCLDPILEQLCDWWEWVTSLRGKEDPFDCSGDIEGNRTTNLHWRHPFGVYNILDEGGSSEIDEYLSTGSMLGMQRTSNLFPELE